MKKIIIIIPTFNEAENLIELVKRIKKLNWVGLYLLFVDDNSPDGTGDLLEELKKNYDFIDIIHNQKKTGLGEAYRAGFNYALMQGADTIGEMDADLSHNPDDLPKLISTIGHDADVVIGSRRIPGGKIVGWSWRRRFTSWSATLLSRLVLELKTQDVTSGFRLYTKAALNNIPWANVKSSGYAWQEELIFLAERAHLKCVEVPITFVDRQHGRSKLSLKDVAEFFITLWRLKRSGPLG